ncbi:hypothetical protein MRS44_018254 [Fusarium solani]|uniref:uncharacterized protein n=1 Tax=Fusarium solani TaxID=169388 RepID=UPI0032C445DA|nr:hypothetical protein MRS44_018254 [Fusarium solani]
MAPKRGLDPEDDTGGFPVQKRRMTELLAALSDLGKTNDTKVNQTDFVEHHKPQANSTVNSSRRKRPARDIEESSLPEREAKRPALNETHPKVLNYKNRVKIYQILQKCTDLDDFYNILNEAHKSGEMTLAQVLHVSPPTMRFKALEQLKPEWGKRLIRMITDIEHEKEHEDPRCLLPTVVTELFLDTLSISNANMRGKDILCVICNRGFCEKNVEKVDIEEVIWKDCGNHLMHTECFRSKVRKGGMPHAGLCPCVGV